MKGLLESCCDLVAEEAVYHGSCHTRFCCLKPMQIQSKHQGRTEHGEKTNHFLKLCDWLESSDDELCSLEDLLKRMQDLAGVGSEIYSLKQLKRKLINKYGEHIVFTDIPGHRNVVCFRNMASAILDETWYSERNLNLQDESKRIVKAAARLLKDSIREAQFSMEEYPCDTTIADCDCLMKWMPPLLQEFMQNLIGHQLKQVAIGHAIVQACWPKSSISPLLFGLGTSIDHVYGSKWLITMLSRLGFSVSSDEVNRFKQSAVSDEKSNVIPPSEDFFTQWSGDNVDHNVMTLDGLGTFHGMGIISMSTPYAVNAISNVKFGEGNMRRLKRIHATDVARNRGIPILSYNKCVKSALTTLNFKPILHLTFPYTLPSSLNIDVVWQTGLFLKPAQPRCNWSGFMQSVSSGHHTLPAQIHMLPIIDLNPGDASCIYSTLLFVQRQSVKLNIVTPCITFDQPLWLKAVDIIQSSELKIVCRLGGFHLLMSFMGSIGTVMAGSGLSEALESCYGCNTVTHMMTGKAYARAIRGHILMESALYSILLTDLEEFLFHADDAENLHVAGLNDLYEAVTNKQCKDVQIDESPAFTKLCEALNAYKLRLSNNSRTAQLWLQYMMYAEVLRMFIRAERTGDWHLHLVSLHMMLNLFAATGHNNYAKCGRLYLQLMLELPDKYPWLYEKFVAGGFHCVRRSNRFWAGLSTDLVIEQVMMKAIKSRGGLTHGRGMTESVRSTWIGSMHRCASVQAAITSLLGIDYASHDSQHVELGKSRMDRDQMDATKLSDWLSASNPFCIDDSRLRSLSSGVAASGDDGINCYAAEAVGNEIMLGMDNVSFANVVMKKAKQVRTLSTLTDKVMSVGKKSQFDSSVLFNRLVIIMQRSDNLESYFTHELTPMPSALFRDRSIRKTDKSQLTCQLTKGLKLNDSSLATKCVIDGGSLLHRVKWQQDCSYTTVIAEHISYVGRHYGHPDSVTIIFDGYGNGPSTKDVKHERRSAKCAPNVVFDENMPAYRSQSAFLSNKNNKKQFVSKLISVFHKAGYTVKQATNDADCLIVETAINIAREGQAVTVVADDTDVFVMLVHHFEEMAADMYMLSEVAKRTGSRPSIVSIREVCAAMGSKAASQILAVHALSGCDTTSSLFGHGKAKVFRKISTSIDTQVLTDTLGSSKSTKDEVLLAGLDLLAMIYGGKPGDSLNVMRYLSYMHQVATSTCQIHPEHLPPTESAAKFHIMRVHFQIIQWKLEPELSAKEWGWRELDGEVPANSN